MKCLFFMYSFTHQVLCICYLSSFFTSPGLSFYHMHILSPFPSGFVEICRSAFPFLCPTPSSRGTRIFPPCSLLSALQFPCINWDSALQRLYRFVLEGQKCRSMFAHGSLSQQCRKTRFQQIPLKPHNIFELSETLAE